MNVRTAIVAATVAAGTLTVAVPVAASAATTTTCSTTHTDRMSTTSTGWTHTVTNENRCGHDYDKWTVTIHWSDTGAHYVKHAYRDEDYPHYYQIAVKDAWTKAGRYSHTVTVTTG